MKRLNQAVSRALFCVAAIALLAGAAQAFDDTEMVTVPAGEFTRGCTQSDQLNECLPEALPVSKVYLDAFKVDKYLVTFRRYNECLKDGACTDLFFGGGCNAGMPWNQDHPVNCVDFRQAEAYCKWDGGKRLLTEAEWEKAARGTDGRRFPWGNESASCDLATMNQKTSPDKMGPGCGAGTSNPVNSKPKGVSPYGLYDMAGNMFEWTSDWFDPDAYKKKVKRNPAGPGYDTGFKAIRGGGSWMMRTDIGMDVSVRFPYAPLGQGYVISFRCAQDMR